MNVASPAGETDITQPSHTDQANDQVVATASENISHLMVMEEEDFRTKIRQSIDTQEALDLSGFEVTLTNRAIRLKGKDKLEIHGGRIQGSIHSLFQIDGDKKNNPRRLTLRNVTLVHTKEHEDPREIGAAVFAMGSSVIVLSECDISSKGGFAVWGKHRCSITVDQCRIHNVARTAVACFNTVNVTVRNTSICQVGIHGVCGRGTSVMTVQNVTLDQCQTRAIMVYHGASISLEDCIITNTQDPTTPTIHAQGPSLEEEEGDTAAEGKTSWDLNLIPTLRMKGCKVSNSAGTPLFLEGQVHQELGDNEIAS